MTTIAYRDGVLAADTGACMGGSMIGGVVKIARTTAGDLVGAAGDASYNRAFLCWAVGGENGDPPEAVEGDGCIDRGVIFRTNGRIDIFEPRGMFFMSSPYLAIGSGRAEALGAMFVGADAETAVRAAMHHDPHTGGEIIVLRHEGEI